MQVVITIFSHFAVSPLQCIIMPVVAPKPCVAGQHSIKRNYRTSSVFVAYFHPYSDIFRFSFLQDSITKLSMIGGSQLIDVCNNNIISYNIIGHIVYVINHNVIAKIAIDNNAVIQPNRHTKIIKLQIV